MSMSNTEFLFGTYYGDGVDYTFIHVYSSMELSARFCMIPQNHPAYRCFEHLPIIPA